MTGGAVVVGCAVGGAMVGGCVVAGGTTTVGGGTSSVGVGGMVLLEVQLALIGVKAGKRVTALPRMAVAIAACQILPASWPPEPYK